MKFWTNYFCEECECCVLRAESQRSGRDFLGRKFGVILAAESLA